MAADVVEKENVREYANKSIDKQKNNSKYEETGKEKDDDSKKNIKVTREQFKKFFTDEK